MDICKSKVPAIEPIGQSLMINPAEVQNRGMKVVKMARVLHRPITERIGFATVSYTHLTLPTKA